eukprot:g8747.t1
MPENKRKRPSERYKHKLNSGPGSPKGKPRKSGKSGQSKAAKRLTGGSRAKANKGGGGGGKGKGRSAKDGKGGGGRGGSKNSTPRRLEKKTAKKPGFFTLLTRRLCGNVNIDVNLSETAQRYLHLYTYIKCAYSLI